MDEDVLRAIAKWPDVPAVFGWMKLDRRGRFWVKDTLVTHALSQAFIGRNFCGDEKGRWYFQNGPQRVFVALEETPLVFYRQNHQWRDQLGRKVVRVQSARVDELGNLYLVSDQGIGLIDDRDLVAFVAAFRNADGELLDPASEATLLESIGDASVAEVFVSWDGRLLQLKSTVRQRLPQLFGFVRNPEPE